MSLILPVTLTPASDPLVIEACGLTWFSVSPQNPQSYCEYKISWPRIAGANVEMTVMNQAYSTPQNANILTCPQGKQIIFTAVSGNLLITYRK